MRYIVFIIIIFFFSCTKTEKGTESIKNDTIDLHKQEVPKNVRLQYKDIISRNDSLLIFVLGFQNDKELNEILNKEYIIKSDVDSLEIYKYELKEYSVNNYLEIDWTMPSGQLMIGKDLYKIIHLYEGDKLIKLHQTGFSNRGLYLDSITIFKFMDGKMEIDSLTSNLFEYRKLDYFTQDTSLISQLDCFDLVYEVSSSDDLIHINLQGRPNSCAPGEYMDLEKNNIKERISIKIGSDKLFLEE